MKQLPIESSVDLRKRKFYVKLLKSECPLLQHLYINAGVTYLNDLNLKYNVCSSVSDGKFFEVVWNKFDRELAIQA